MSENTNLKIALDNASDLFNNNNLNECIEQIEEILKIHPSNLKALSLLLEINIKPSSINVLTSRNQGFKAKLDGEL